MSARKNLTTTVSQVSSVILDGYLEWGVGSRGELIDRALLLLCLTQSTHTPERVEEMLCELRSYHPIKRQHIESHHSLKEPAHDA